MTEITKELKEKCLEMAEHKGVGYVEEELKREGLQKEDRDNLIEWLEEVKTWRYFE